jgi:copper chaperone CopZ
MPDSTGARLLDKRPAVVAGLAAGAGFLTRPCCVLPALLALGGTGSAAVTQSLAAHRPVFLTASAVLLAGSLWMNLRLQTRPSNRWLTAIAAAISFGLAAGPQWYSHVWQGEVSMPNRETVQLKVDGIVCGACAARVGRILLRVDGVVDAAVDRGEGRARILYDPARTDPLSLARAIAQAGFEVGILP